MEPNAAYGILLMLKMFLNSKIPVGSGRRFFLETLVPAIADRSDMN